jgi:hypothetical protein
VEEQHYLWILQMDGWQAETVFSSMKRMFGEYIRISQKISEHGQ